MLQAYPGLRLAVLFGSTARGRRRKDSDVDVAILPQAPLGAADGDLALQSALTLAAGAEVDLVRLDQASTLLKLQVAKTGAPIFEIKAGEFARFSARAAGEYVDFEPSFTRYAEAFRRRLAEPRRRT